MARTRVHNKSCNKGRNESKRASLRAKGKKCGATCITVPRHAQATRASVPMRVAESVQLTDLHERSVQPGRQAA
jgi:hypothetical protein